MVVLVVLVVSMIVTMVVVLGVGRGHGHGCHEKSGHCSQSTKSSSISRSKSSLPAMLQCNDQVLGKKVERKRNCSTQIPIMEVI